MKKVLSVIAAAYAVCVAVGCVVASSFLEAVQNAVYSAMLIGIVVFFVGGFVYSAKADKEMAQKGLG